MRFSFFNVLLVLAAFNEQQVVNGHAMNGMDMSMDGPMYVVCCMTDLFNSSIPAGVSLLDKCSHISTSPLEITFGFLDGCHSLGR